MNHRKILWGGSFVVFMMLAVPLAFPQEQSFKQYCAETFRGNKECPAKICQFVCAQKLDSTPDSDCVESCVPKSCREISAKDCPEQFCAVMTDCSEQKICHFQMVGEKASCGDLAYEGQDVECCEGLVRRCGIEFLDGTCDMEGKNSEYNLPICIPCGDGICGQFENRCNCSEDCGTAPDIPLVEYYLPANQLNHQNQQK